MCLFLFAFNFIYAAAVFRAKIYKCSCVKFEIPQFDSQTLHSPTYFQCEIKRVTSSETFSEKKLRR